MIVSLLLENTTSSELQLGSNATGSSYSFSHSMTFRGRGSLGRRFLLPTDQMRTRRHCSWRLSQHWNIQAELRKLSKKKVEVDVTTSLVPLFVVVPIGNLSHRLGYQAFEQDGAARLRVFLFYKLHIQILERS